MTYFALYSWLDYSPFQAARDDRHRPTHDTARGPSPGRVTANNRTKDVPETTRNDTQNKYPSYTPSNKNSSNQTIVSKPEDLKVPPSKVICITFSGRLGNQMFQYAAVMGLALRLNRIPVFGANDVLQKTLQTPPPTASGTQRQRCRSSKELKEDKCCYFQEKFLGMDANQDYTVSQYLQSWKYFEGFEPEIRTAMRFKDSVQSSANKLIEELRAKWNRTLVGIHVRRGDYLRDIHVKMGYRTAPAEYFLRSMSYMRQKFGNVMFLVSTDGKQWFKTNVTSSSDVIMLEQRDAATDMALLASVDHVITSVGTFSWWIGFLNGGITVYWKDFIVPGTEIGNGFLPNGTTFVHPSWIPM